MHNPETYLGVIGRGSGAGCCCAGGTDFTGADFVPSRTDPVLWERRAAKTDSVIDVSMKMTAAQVVALVSIVAAVRVPNAVWLPMPPKAAAMSPLWPLCSRTTMMRKAQTIM